MWSYFASIMSISSAHTASLNSSSREVVLQNRAHPQNILRTRMERSSRSIWFKPPALVPLETSLWGLLEQVQAPLHQVAAPASPTLWAFQCHPRNGGTRDRHHPLSSRTWPSLTSNAMGYPRTSHAVGRIYPRYTYYTRQHTNSYIHIYIASS